MKTSYHFWILNHYAGNLSVGMEYRHFFLARHLVRMGHQVSIISSTFSHLYSSPPVQDTLVSENEVDGIKFVWLKVPRYQGNGVMRFLNMLSYSFLVQVAPLEKRLGRPDVILGSSPHPFSMLNTLSLAKRFKIPSLIEIRDLWPLMLIELGSLSPTHPLAKIFQWIEYKAFTQADRVISLWHSADNYMLQHGVDAERYRYLPNGIELDDSFYTGTHPLLDAVDAEKKLGKFVVGYGGSHGHANPLSQVVDACYLLQEKGVNNISFFMVGDGPDKLAAKTKAEALNLSNLHWFDSVSKDVVMTFYEKLDCTFIGLKDLPLFKYGPTPNKLMDYLAVGKPIIYAIRSSFDPVSEHELGITIVPDKGEALVDALESMRDLPQEKRNAMGTRARSFAEKEHSYAALAKKLDDIITELL